MTKEEKREIKKLLDQLVVKLTPLREKEIITNKEYEKMMKEVQPLINNYLTQLDSPPND